MVYGCVFIISYSNNVVIKSNFIIQIQHRINLLNCQFKKHWATVNAMISSKIHLHRCHHRRFHRHCQRLGWIQRRNFNVVRRHPSVVIANIIQWIYTKIRSMHFCKNHDNSNWIHMQPPAYFNRKQIIRHNINHHGSIISRHRHLMHVNSAHLNHIRIRQHRFERHWDHYQLNERWMNWKNLHLKAVQQCKIFRIY